MNKKIIGFAGRKRSGKTCLSKYLAEKYNGTVVTVADALKHLCCDLLGFESIEELNTYKDNGTSWSFNKDKEAPRWTKIICDEVFVNYADDEYNEILKLIEEIKTYSVRDILQFVGTDIIRKFKPNWHVEKMVEAIKKAPTDLVCVDDVRFPNEREAIESLGGIVFFVMRPDLSVDISNHESEVSLTWPLFGDNRIIFNMFDLPFVLANFDEAYETQFFLTGSNPIFANNNNKFKYRVNRYFGYIGTNKPYDLYSTKCNVDEFNLIRHVILHNIKKHNGCIVLHPTNEVIMNTYSLRIYGHPMNNNMYTIVVWNPFIIENLKAWL